MKKVIDWKKREQVVLILILLLAAWLRFWRLGDTPIALFGDEVDIGYQAYSLWKTGRDYLGNSWPIYFHSFAEYRMPLLVYLTTPIVGIFGPSEWTVRFLPALFGVLDVLLLYLLLKITTNERIALLGAALIATAPWAIHFSRMAFDVTLMLSILLLAMIFLAKAEKRDKYFYFFSLVLPLSFYAYSTATLFSLLFFLPMVVFILKKKKKLFSKIAFQSGAIFLLMTIPFLIAFFQGEASSRFSGINIFNDSKIIDQIVYRRWQDQGKGRFYHNKLTGFGRRFLENYFSSFSTEFLFISGDPNPRQSSGTGEFFKIIAPFLFLGTFVCWQKKRWLFFWWLLAAPIPSVLTMGGGRHATRLFLLLPPLVLFTAEGIGYFWDLIRKKQLAKLVMAGVGFVFLLELCFYLHQYYNHWRLDSWEYFDYGAKEAFKTVKNIGKEYDLILVNSQKPLLTEFLFWLKVDPEWFQKNYHGQGWQKDIVPGFDGFRVGKFVFGRANKDLQEILTPNILYLAYQKDEIPGGWDWQKEPPGGVEVKLLVREPISNKPYLYLLSGKKEE